ncbi:IQ domain-containing protein K-like [Harmonia axyridis]|uniref:IQ domain-containing protein K-like n=1 Tax=Harmonia axyridis TaxID=115357 RepID=UPI001E277902|nr:IQ domain-containing protein K-like [Harmonia axyridis]
MASSESLNCCCLSGVTCVCESSSDKNKLWNEICREIDEEKRSVQNYILKNNKNADVPSHPLLDFLETKVTPLLKKGMLSALKEAERQNCLDRQRTDFDPIDHISEYLWNNNPEFPQRLNENKKIHDMHWVMEYLKENPRPFFPYHLIWSNDFAAIKIQAFLRGYWVRRQEEVQEVRRFWKQLKEEAQGSGTSISRRFLILD